MDRNKLEEQLSLLPLYTYAYIDPKTLEFSQRIRWICQHECPMYGKTWACPPGVGSVEACQHKCLSYNSCLMIGTIVETEDISNIDSTLSTRGDHEMLTNQVRDLMLEQGVAPYILSTEACSVCQRCAILDGKPCRLPEKMHPCLESHGINIIPTLEENGLEFQYGGNVITWYSLLFFNE
jgi:predicted metal-binding protein